MAPRRLYVLLGIILILLLAIGASVYIAALRASSAQRARTDAGWSLIGRAIAADDHTIGEIGAPVQVIAYSSLSCKYCRQFFSEELPRLESAYPHMLVIAYRHNPIPQ